MKDIDTKRPRRLDLNAPLLSTRRANLITAATSLALSRTGSARGSSTRVPFSWEQTPGKPKVATERDRNNNVGVEGNDHQVFPLPKPPLIRWKDEDFGGESNNDENNKNDDDDDDNGSFSDVIDLFSLAESLNTSERLDFESDFNGDNGSLSPNFMIQRFLPAATALAASSLSALAANKEHRSRSSTSNSNNNSNSGSNKSFMGVSEGSCVPRITGEAYSSSKGCGFEIFFPWRAKHRLCGVKSPVRQVQSSLKPQLNPKK